MTEHRECQVRDEESRQRLESAAKEIEELKTKAEVYRLAAEGVVKVEGPSEEITAKTLEKACYALPSCWTGTTISGESIHIHLRRGDLYVEVGDREVFRAEYEDRYAGLMYTPEMLRITGVRYEGNPHQIDADAWNAL